MAIQWLNQEYYNNKTIRSLQKRFSKGKPYPYLILKNLFAEKKITAVKKALSKEVYKTIDKDLFTFSTTKDLVFSKNSVLQDFHQFIASKEFRAHMQQITGEKLGRISDLHGHQFAQGDYLLCHDDKVDKRKLAFVINLSDGFTKRDGGRLLLYDVKKPNKPVKKIVPTFNTLVCFKVSRKSLHAVEEVFSNKKRLTLGGWFYGN